MFRWRLGMSAGGAGFSPSHVRWSVFRRRRGTSPSPTLGRRRCRRRGTSAGHTFVRRSLFRWRLGMGAGGAGFRPSHVRWSVFRRRRGTSPSPTLGRRRCRRPVGDEGRRYRVPGLPRPVVGVSPAAGDKPQPYIGTAALPPAGDERRPYICSAVIVSLAVGDGRRRCRVPALPRPVVGVSPAAGDKPQPYIWTVALPPDGWGWAPAVQGSGPPASGGRCFAGGGGQAPALH